MKEYTTEELKALDRESWSEDTFTAKVIAYAQGCGFKVAHFRPAETARGWRTAVQGDGKGFPDVVGGHLRRGTGFAWELKVKRNKPSPEQSAWIGIFSAIGLYSRVMRPGDWDEITAYLEGRK